MGHHFCYLPFNDELKARSLYIIGAGHTLVPPNTDYPLPLHPADHDFQWRGGRTLQEYAAVYITRGKGVFESKTLGPRQVQAGSLFVLFPGEWHRYKPDLATGWEEYWLTFQGMVAGALMAEHRLSPAKALLDVGVDDALVQDFLRLNREIREQQIGFRPLIESLAALILARATALPQRNSLERSAIPHMVEKAKRLFSENIDKTLNLEETAAALDVEYSRFRWVFRRHTGLPPQQYHLQLRISHACELLRSTTLPISEIGARTGFDSAYYFARIFRSKIGCPPREYRRNIHSSAPAPDTERLHPFDET